MCVSIFWLVLIHTWFSCHWINGLKKKVRRMTKLNESDIDFQGKLLLATPRIQDLRFEKAVILICSHNSDGAMGIIVNKPTIDLKFKDILGQLNINPKPASSDYRIYFGGPVEYGRGFVIHSPDYKVSDESIKIKENCCLTANIDILRDIAEGRGPKDSMLALGYSGWGPGQLESEVFADSWLLCESDNDLVFSLRPETKWKGALKKIGVTPSHLVTLTGSA